MQPRRTNTFQEELRSKKKFNNFLIFKFHKKDSFLRRILRIYISSPCKTFQRYATFHTKKICVFFLAIQYAETVYIKEKRGLVRVAVTFLWRGVAKKESWARKLIFPPPPPHPCVIHLLNYRRRK